VKENPSSSGEICPIPVQRFEALLTVASEKYNGLQWSHLASGRSVYSAPSIQSAVAVEGEVWGVDEQEPCVVMFYPFYRFLYGPCMNYVCLIL
jgi:hypothetical protein